MSHYLIGEPIICGTPMSEKEVAVMWKEYDHLDRIKAKKETCSETKKSKCEVKQQYIPKTKTEARIALEDFDWLEIWIDGHSDVIGQVLVLAEFSSQERILWNQTSGFQDFFDEIAPFSLDLRVFQACGPSSILGERTSF